MSKQRNAGNRNRGGNNGQSNMLKVKIDTNTSAKVDPKSISGWTTHSDPAAGVHSIRSTKLGDSIVLNNIPGSVLHLHDGRVQDRDQANPRHHHVDDLTPALRSAKTAPPGVVFYNAVMHFRYTWKIRYCAPQTAMAVRYPANAGKVAYFR